jgi:hypothetical protein
MIKIELPYVSVSFESPIVYYSYKEGAQLGFPEMRELIATAEKLSWSRPYFTFSDVRVTMDVTREGKRYISDPNNLPYFRGAAVLVRGSMLSFAINFLSHFQKNKYPFKAFTDKNKAITWLGTLDLDNNQDGQWGLA